VRPQVPTDSSSPLAASLVRARLVLYGGAKHSRYRAALRDADRQSDVWSGEASSDGKAVEAEIPGAVLRNADYVLILSGLTGDGKWQELDLYQFSVIRR